MHEEQQQKVSNYLQRVPRSVTLNISVLIVSN